MAKYRVVYQTPQTSYSTEHTCTDTVIAKSIPDAITKSVSKYVKAKSITLIGIDTVDSFHGLDRETYDLEKNHEAKFTKLLENMIQTVERVEK